MHDEKSFLDLLRRHEGILYKVSRMYADDTDDRRDLVQEISYQLWKAYPGFRGESRFSTWMYRIALNTALGRFRRREVPVDAATELPEVTETLTEDPRMNQLFAAIRRLSRSDRALIALYLEDLSLPEIGEILGITANNAGVKLHRAKKKLKTRLNP